jgi:prepilin-type processing-associated H-X9-DG protein
MTCQNNMKQIGLAIQLYHDSNNCFPIGRWYAPGSPAGGTSQDCSSLVTGQSFLVSILPFVEQANLYNQINLSGKFFSFTNTSVMSITPGNFACPSDTNSGSLRTSLVLGRVAADPGAPQMPLSSSTTSYCGVAGSDVTLAIPLVSNDCRPTPASIARSNGIITDVAPIRASSVSDGLSSTMVACERAVSLFKDIKTDRTMDPPTDQLYGWWFSGETGDTLVTSYYRPNIYRAVATSCVIPRISSASSLHPAGTNVLMGDGSVRTIRDSVESWPISSTGEPILLPPSSFPPRGVWQSLGSRNGGEIISIDGL